MDARRVKKPAQDIEAMLSLAEYVESDACTPEERKLLRVLAGIDGVFRLSNVLNRLCGEKVRELGRKGSANG